MWAARAPAQETRQPLLLTYPDWEARIVDERVNLSRYTDSVFQFPAYHSRQDWLDRAAYLRRHILVGCGLWPLPERTPLQAHIVDRHDDGDYTIEKVWFQSAPGLYVTGNLYRPAGKPGPFPGVLSPHGHWRDGRLADEPAGSVPGRAIGLARQGCVVFSYDMLGYNDSFQVNHAFGGEGLDEAYSPQRRMLWGVSAMGLQLWNSIRALDFLCELPDVDPDRLACTGASGGGTQTFMLTAVDDRVKVSAPVNMISAHFQGGCECENAPLARVNTYNVEIGALMAPRPMILVCATGDWTKNTPEVEYPAIKSIYALFGAEDRIAYHLVDAGHNYNQASREAVYTFFDKWLLGGPGDPVQEQPFQVERPRELLVWWGHDLPKEALSAVGIVEHSIVRSERQLESCKPTDAESLARLRTLYGSGLEHCLGAQVPAPDQLRVENLGEFQAGGATVSRLVLGRKNAGDALPALLMTPSGTGVEGITVVIHGEGKRALMSSDATAPGELLAVLLASGQAVLAVDAFLTGEYHPPGGATERKLEGRFPWTFYWSDTALRVQDIITAVQCAKGLRPDAAVSLVGVGDAGLWCLLARPFLTDIGSTAADLAGFAGSEADYERRLFSPLLRRVGDLRAAGALCAPGRLMVHNAGAGLDLSWLRAGYRAAGAEGNLAVRDGQASVAEIIDWLGGGR
jgi:dienelactone hydrolase